MRRLQLFAIAAIAAVVLVVVVDAASSASYNVRTKKEIRSLTDDLPYNADHKLTTHYLLYASSDDKACGREQFSLPTNNLFQDAVVSGPELREKLFQDASAASCQAVCLERGVDQSVAGAVLQHKYYNYTTTTTTSNDDDTVDFGTWFRDTCLAVEVCFMNYHSRNSDAPLQLFWMHPGTGQRQHHLDLLWGEKNTRCFNSFLGHEFQAIDGTTGEVVGTHRVEFNTIRAFGESPPSGHVGDDDDDDHNNNDFTQQIESTLRHEWRRHQRIQRTYSPLGFSRGRLPDDIFASMGAFLYNNHHHKVREEWHGRGVFVNWWETDCSFIQIPWHLKSIWQDRLRLLVEAWAGEPLEQTDMYGLRQYEAGARLLTHVDREATHAVSLIVNIAQGNLTQPWPVEILDHANRLHEVVMKPGDVVYYESAKCLHGRNRPLMGENAYYVNLFTHYRPVGDPEWFEKDNLPGTPEPVLEDETTTTKDGAAASCRLETVRTTELEGGSLGLIETVRCDDERLGPYVSPSLFQAKSADDLIQWWRQTAPPATTKASSAAGTTRDEL